MYKRGINLTKLKFKYLKSDIKVQKINIEKIDETFFYITRVRHFSNSAQVC